MPLTLTPTSELEAVNTMLTTIGEAPVNTLEEQHGTDVALAQRILHEISRDTQTIEWFFNSEQDYPLSRTPQGQIMVPLNALRVEFSPDVLHGDIQPIHRGDKLYDLKNHTDKFTQNLKAKILFFLPFNELPEAARRYITIKSSRTFQDRVLGSETIHTYSRTDEQHAWVNLRAADMDLGNHTWNSSETVKKILRRR